MMVNPPRLAGWVGAAAALLLGMSGALPAGVVEGRISAQGKALPDAEDDERGNAYASRKYRFLEKIDYEGMTDFVVWLEGGNPPPPTNEVARSVVVQKGGAFSPRVLPIRVGTEVQWPNNDEVLHNAFSYSEAKQFDLGLYSDMAKPVLFDVPGRVDVFCSIHKNMHCVILVLETAWFAATDAQGNFTIADVPPGRYRLRTWHERLPPAVREIDVTESETTRVDVVMGVMGLPQY